MKTIIKKLISIKNLPVLALALLVVFGTALATSREPISISGQVTATPEGPFVGPAELAVRDDTFTGQVTVYVNPDQIEVKDGVTHYKWVMHVFEFGEVDTLTTIGEEFAVPTDENQAVLTLHGDMEITGGTGAFDDASGELRVNGQMNVGVTPPEATFKANGVISR